MLQEAGLAPWLLVVLGTSGGAGTGGGERAAAAGVQVGETSATRAVEQGRAG